MNKNEAGSLRFLGAAAAAAAGAVADGESLSHRHGIRREKQLLNYANELYSTSHSLAFAMKDRRWESLFLLAFRSSTASHWLAPLACAMQHR